jgi:hypothetical protein
MQWVLRLHQRAWLVPTTLALLVTVNPLVLHAPMEHWHREREMWRVLVAHLVKD